MTFNIQTFELFVRTVLLRIIRKLIKMKIKNTPLLSEKGKLHLKSNAPKIIQATIKNCTRADKMSLDYLLNPLFSELQYESVAGFDLGRFEHHTFMPYSIATPKTVQTIAHTKRYWNTLMMTQLSHLSQYLKITFSTSQTLLMCSEEYDINTKPSPDDANQNEFKSFVHSYENNTLSRMPSTSTYFLSNDYVYHQCIDISKEIMCINVHNSSNQSVS